MVKKIISVIILAAILITGVLISQPLLINSDKEKADLNAAYKFYKDNSETVDVCYLGSSPVYAGISPLTVWQEEGITGVNFATSSQNALLTYYQLKSIAEIHKPKAIVLELSSLFEDRKADEEKYGNAHHKITETLPTFKAKKELIKNIVADNEEQTSFKYWCSFYMNHHLWGQVRPSTFKSFTTSNCGGIVRLDEFKPFDIPEDYVFSEEISEYSDKYYDKLFTFCKENDIKVLVVQFPKTGERLWSKTRTEKYTEYCKEKNLTYLNLNSPEAFEYMKIDSIKDFYDPGHLNAYGNLKISQILAKALKKEFNLENHKSDPKYKLWENDYKVFSDKYKKYIDVTPDF